MKTKYILLLFIGVPVAFVFGALMGNYYDNMRKSDPNSVFSAVDGVSIISWVQGYFFKSAAVGICEERLIANLKAPATYRFVDSSETREPATESDLVVHRRKVFKNPESAKISKAEEMLIGLHGNPEKVTVLLTYDAQNSFGALLRGYAICESVGLHGFKPSKYDYLLNGESYFDY